MQFASFMVCWGAQSSPAIGMHGSPHGAAPEFAKDVKVAPTSMCAAQKQSDGIDMSSVHSAGQHLMKCIAHKSPLPAF